MGQLHQAWTPFSGENAQPAAQAEDDLETAASDSEFQDAEEVRHAASSACSEDESFQDAMSEGMQYYHFRL